MARATQNRVLLILMSLAAAMGVYSVATSFMATLENPNTSSFVYADPGQ